MTRKKKVQRRRPRKKKDVTLSLYWLIPVALLVIILFSPSSKVQSPETPEFCSNLDSLTPGQQMVCLQSSSHTTEDRSIPYGHRFSSPAEGEEELSTLDNLTVWQPSIGMLIGILVLLGGAYIAVSKIQTAIRISFLWVFVAIAVMIVFSVPNAKVESSMKVQYCPVKEGAPDGVRGWLPQGPMTNDWLELGSCVSSEELPYLLTGVNLEEMKKSEGFIAVLQNWIKSTFFRMLGIFRVNAEVECGATPTPMCIVSADTTFTPGIYEGPIFVVNSNVELDCNGANISQGIEANEGANGGYNYNVTIKNCVVHNGSLTLFLEPSGPAHNITLYNNEIYPADTFFMPKRGGGGWRSRTTQTCFVVDTGSEGAAYPPGEDLVMYDNYCDAGQSDLDFSPAHIYQNTFHGVATDGVHDNIYDDNDITYLWMNCRVSGNNIIKNNRAEFVVLGSLGWLPGSPANQCHNTNITGNTISDTIWIDSSEVLVQDNTVINQMILEDNTHDMLITLNDFFGWVVMNENVTNVKFDNNYARLPAVHNYYQISRW